jgi:predicted nucleotidyltransferase
MDIEKEITELCIKRFGDNLAGVVVFGSYLSGPYVQGISDIDCLVYLKLREGMNLENEGNILTTLGKSINLSIQNLETVEGSYERIYSEGSWSTWITLVCGSRIIYQTEQFSDFILRLRNRNLMKERIIEYIKHKDSFELSIYLHRLTDWNLTKALYSHIRRKLQILSFEVTKQPVFDYRNCLTNIKTDDETKHLLLNLASYYEQRRPMTREEAEPYFDISAELTKKIILDFK